MLRVLKKPTCLLKGLAYVVYIAFSIYVFGTVVHQNNVDAQRRKEILKLRRVKTLNTSIVFYREKEHTIRTALPSRKKDQAHNQITNFTLTKFKYQYPLDVDMEKLLNFIENDEEIPLKTINPHPFKYIANPMEKCGSNETLLLILIKSAAVHVQNRYAIRSTWGNLSHEFIKIVFLIGSTKFDKYILQESEKNKDIVQENFIDVYRNNTYKTIMGFNWARSYCSHAKYLFFVDDDFIVNIDNLIRFVKQGMGRPIFSGFLLSKSKPYRDKKSKWYVSRRDYSHDSWPPYLAGGAYLVSMNVVKMFSSIFPFVKFLPIDDSYLGIIAYKLGIIPTNNVKMSMSVCNDWKIRMKIACHGFKNAKKLTITWNRVFRRRTL